MKKVEKVAKKMVRGGKREKGFTLIELLIVIGILAIVAAVAIPNLTKFMGRGKGESWDSDQNSIQTLVGSYQAEYYGAYPTINGQGGDVTSNYILWKGQMTPTTIPGALTTAAVAGAKTISVNSLTGIFAGRRMQITDAAGNQTVIVAGVSGTASPYTVTLNDSLTIGHTVVATTFVALDQGLADSAVGLLAASPKSALKSIGGAESTSKGSYTWYCDANGAVKSNPDRNDKVYP